MQNYSLWPLLCKLPTILLAWAYPELLLLFLVLLPFLSSSCPPFLSVCLSYSPISLFLLRCSLHVRYILLFGKPYRIHRMPYQSLSLLRKVLRI
jgi:hypothetical protein